MYEIIAITWTGQAFTGIQMLAMRNAAARFLRGGRKTPTFHFKHESIEGEITRTKVGSVGTFSGMMFHADCGTVKGERWTMDFLIPRGTEQVFLTGEDTVVCHRYTALPNGDYGVKEEIVQQGSKRKQSERPSVH